MPTKENLVRRKVLIDSVSDECGELLESSLHLFWVCPKARETWDCSSLCNLMTSTFVQSFFDFLWNILMESQWGVEESGLAVTIAWAL